MSDYGTVMIAKLAVPFEEFEGAMRERPNPPGLLHGHLMRGDDGATVVGAFIFESRDSYAALADNTDQAKWYAEVIAPMLDGDATWHDGVWALEV